jgi:hypothetical protein
MLRGTADQAAKIREDGRLMLHEAKALLTSRRQR